MKPTNSIIAIIPARKGSKRIPNKNIKFFFGKPIIAHTIINLKKTKIFDQIIVSTDSKKIANIAKKYGAKVPFLRPLNLAGDKAGTTEVIAHAVSWLTNNGYRIKNVCCIYPTSVLIQKDDLKLGLKFLKLKKWDYIFSAAAYEHPIFRSFKQNSKKKIKLLFPKKINQRTQDLDKVYHDVGQFYWGTDKSWIKEKEIFSSRSKIIVIPRWRAQDIDDHYDWKKAENIYRILNKKKRSY